MPCPEAQFEQDMRALYQRCVREGVPPAHFIWNWISELGAKETARRLIALDPRNPGLTTLWERGKLHLSTEWLVLLPTFEDCFPVEVRQRAYDNLAAYDFKDLTRVPRPL